MASGQKCPLLIRNMGRINYDLVGKRFGRLTVVKFYESRNKTRYWECLCDCGNTKIVSSSCLVHGVTKSCGCLARDITVNRNKQNKIKNKYDLSGEYGIGYTSNGTEFKFDIEDYEKIVGYCWNVNSLNYITSHGENRETIYLHRIIMDVSGIDWKENQVDHINHDTTDNRKTNLRIVSARNNGINKSIQSNNTSGVKGVSWHKGINKWIARISYSPNKRITLGSFDNFEDAVIARKAAEQKYYGEYNYSD